MALALFVILGPTTLHRIRREDQHLAEVYGQRFARYTRRVKRLVPGIY
jgi:protein-S-isoprenylcysteine O-methyltransferase Ste14